MNNAMASFTCLSLTMFFPSLWQWRLGQLQQVSRMIEGARIRTEKVGQPFWSSKRVLRRCVERVP